ncbi:MAG: hypothetical protein LBJ00_09515 [Planctomycetaceae bacterium]|nr:hypothetical protein [Planctomycetaceae bacterium]
MCELRVNSSCFKIHKVWTRNRNNIKRLFKGEVYRPCRFGIIVNNET